MPLVAMNGVPQYAHFDGMSGVPQYAVFAGMAEFHGLMALAANAKAVARKAAITAAVSTGQTRAQAVKTVNTATKTANKLTAQANKVARQAKKNPTPVATTPTQTPSAGTTATTTGTDSTGAALPPPPLTGGGTTTGTTDTSGILAPAPTTSMTAPQQQPPWWTQQQPQQYQGSGGGGGGSIPSGGGGGQPPPGYPDGSGGYVPMGQQDYAPQNLDSSDDSAVVTSDDDDAKVATDNVVKTVDGSQAMNGLGDMQMMYDTDGNMTNGMDNFVHVGTPRAHVSNGRPMSPLALDGLGDYYNMGTGIRPLSGMGAFPDVSSIAKYALIGGAAYLAYRWLKKRK